MRIQQTELFTFEELTEDAQSKALLECWDWNVGDSYWNTDHTKRSDGTWFILDHQYFYIGCGSGCRYAYSYFQIKIIQ